MNTGAFTVKRYKQKIYKTTFLKLKYNDSLNQLWVATVLRNTYVFGSHVSSS